MKRTIFICITLLLTTKAFTQTENIDSLVSILETGKPTIEEQIELYQKITALYIHRDLEKGIEYSRKGLEFALKNKNKRFTAISYNRLGVAYYLKSSLDTAQVYLKKSLDLTVEINDEVLIMGAYTSLANLYRLKQDYEEALNYYMKSLSLHKIPVSAVHAKNFNNIAVIHRILNNPDRAIYYFEQGLEIANQQNFDDEKMAAIYGMGTIYGDKNDYTKAIECFREALEISRKIGNKPYEIISTISLAECFEANKEFNKALDYAHEGLQIAEVYGGPRHIHGVWSTISRIYQGMGRYKECEEAALKSWAIDSTSLEEAAGSAFMLTISNIHLGNKGKAEYFLNKYNDIIKSGNEKSLHNSLSDMEIKYETEKKEIRIASLEKERQLYIWLGAIGFLLALALGVILRQKTKNVQKEKQLIATRSVLDGEMGERARLARDLHDRLSGNLSAVRIGLNNDTDSLQNVCNKLDGCIEEIRRVAHNLMPVSLQFGMKVALEDFAAQFSNVHFHFFGEDKRIESRKEFVIYCCANELVTNALRHANAKEINLQLVQNEKHVSITIQDDGCGFDEKTVIEGFGLKNIRDRVASCDGKIDIVSSPGMGTEVTIEIKTNQI